MKFLFSLLSIFFFSIAALANVELPRFFSDNMVLQRNKPIPVWGWASPKEKITVSFNGQTQKVKAGKDGKWRVDLSPVEAGGPYTLTISGKNSISINNVLVGEVWICSGQSNMEMPIAGWGKIDNYKEEIAAADFPQIRQFTVPKKVASLPLDTLSGGDWMICNPENAGDFTAAGYFFARELYQKLKVPIGLINTTWGGTQVESWISRSGFEQSTDFSSMIAEMANSSLDEMMRKRDDAFQTKLKELQGATAVTATEVANWKTMDFDDANWHTMKAPQLWEEQEPGEVDGVIWYRKTIELPGSAAGKPASLDLAMIDDNDECYVNGVKIGSTTGYNVERHYSIPAELLKSGKNVIAIRVEDTGGGGGLYGQEDNLKLTVANQEYKLAGDWKYRIEKMAMGAGGIGPNSYPTLLYNAMIKPLIPYAFKGVIWYQGEANAGRAYEYRKSFPLLINDWRSKWNAGDFPFYFVQLSTWRADHGTSQNGGSNWAELREAQAMTLSLPHTGMAVTTDIGNVEDIHPKNKQDVGKRLAAIALSKDYGMEQEFSGPLFEKATAENGKMKVSFTHADKLMVKDKYGYIKGFEIAGADKQFHYAKAMIEGSKVLVWSDEVSKPVAVRYNWADDASEGNLYNAEGFPTAPFRSDDWEEKTRKSKFQLAQ